MQECDEAKHRAHATPLSLGQAVAKSRLLGLGDYLVHGYFRLDANGLQVARVSHAQQGVHLK